MVEVAADSEVNGNVAPERERSTISFPYGDLDFSLTLVRAVNEVGGSTCGWDQAALQLQMEPKAGGFRIKAISAKIFGFLTYGQGTIRLTELGRRVLDERQAVDAKAKAFLTVPLYSQLFEKYRGTTLPPPDGLEAEMVSMGVVASQKDKARQTFQRSAQQAGFFWSGTNRLVMPKNVAAATPVPTDVDATDRSDDTDGDQERNRDRDKSKGGGGGGRHFLIQGLIKELPDEGSNWGADDRVKWLQAAATIFELIYKNETNGKGQKIEVSAK